NNVRYNYSLFDPGVSTEAVSYLSMFRLSWYALALLIIGYFISAFIAIPVSVVVGLIALFLIFMGRKSEAVNTRKVIKSAPWSIVFFSIGMYVVVYGLGNAGLTTALAGVLQSLADQGLFIATVGMGFTAAFLS